MKWLIDRLDAIIKVGVAGAIIVGGLAYFAKAEDLRLVQLRLDQKIVSDQLYTTQQQVWELEERNRDYGIEPYKWPDKRDRDRYKTLRLQLDKLQLKEETLLKK